MTTVDELEIKTQRRVIVLFRDGFGYCYLGDWRDRDGNRNVESGILTSFLKRGGHSANLRSSGTGSLLRLLGLDGLARFRFAALE